jgi:hypothetical protein
VGCFLFKIWLFVGAVTSLGCNREMNAPAHTGLEESGDETLIPKLDEKNVRLETSGEVVCKDPSLRSKQGPLYVPDLGLDWESQPVGVRWPEEDSTEQAPGFGLSVADYNGDGYMDIFLPNYGPNVLFFGAENGEMVDSSHLVTDLANAKNAEGVVSADFDGDGDVDILVLNRGTQNRLLENDGAGVFVAREGLFRGAGLNTVGASVGDINKDTILDFVTAERVVHVDISNLKPEDEPNQVFLGTGIGFETANHLVPKGLDLGYTFVSSLIDIDADMWPDLFFLNDFLGYLGNVMLRNSAEVGVTFSDVSQSTFLGAPAASMGLGISDINRDQVPDFIVSTWSQPKLFESDGAGSWMETQTLRGLSHQIPKDVGDGVYAMWAVEFADMNNDGKMDVAILGGTVMTNNEISLNPMEQPDFMWLREGPMFVDVSREWDFDHTAVNRGMVVTDMNGDGWLDILKRNINGLPIVQYSRCGENTWIKVSLHDETMNRRAIGAVVEVFANDEAQQTKWVLTGSTSLSSSGPATLHFGLESALIVNAVRITWPDGQQTVFKDIPTNQHLQFYRGEK